MKTVEIVLTDSDIHAFNHEENANNFAFNWWKEELTRSNPQVENDPMFFDRVNEKVINSRSNPWSDLLGIFTLEVED